VFVVFGYSTSSVRWTDRGRPNKPGFFLDTHPKRPRHARTVQFPPHFWTQQLHLAFLIALPIVQVPSIVSLFLHNLELLLACIPVVKHPRTTPSAHQLRFIVVSTRWQRRKSLSSTQWLEDLLPPLSPLKGSSQKPKRQPRSPRVKQLQLQRLPPHPINQLM